MVSLNNKQSGFTIVELLIVIVIIGILAGLVITTFVGIQQRARNSERQTDINAIANQLEGYFAKNSGYPSNADLNDETWRENNEVKLGADADGKALDDPSGAFSSNLSTTNPVTAIGEYSYVPGPVGCVSPTDNANPPEPNAGTFCDSFTLRAFMEGNADVLSKTSAN